MTPETEAAQLYIADSIVPFNGSTQQFINAISVEHPAKNKSSEMHRIFEMIARILTLMTSPLCVRLYIVYSDEVLRKKGNENINRISSGRAESYHDKVLS
ncbi:hypothetical protein [Chitinophaga pinensis]|uniref:Uncharacterized protein n=1 Tax=Chitinophaga pinensis TaxID=79329 RepID=A0A5C6LP80_9BACT|nr:hypothetical protein [Chitinophaga pinensis]TWV92998.1 hypothetical protein FEF09_27855 [Chitinophaga pinensis]